MDKKLDEIIERLDRIEKSLSIPKSVICPCGCVTAGRCYACHPRGTVHGDISVSVSGFPSAGGDGWRSY